MLAEIVRLAHTHGRLTPDVASAIKRVAVAIGVDAEALAERGIGGTRDGGASMSAESILESQRPL